MARPALKALVANVVYERLKGSSHWGSWERVRSIKSVNNIKVSWVSNLVCEIRVDTDEGSISYTVSVSEPRTEKSSS